MKLKENKTLLHSFTNILSLLAIVMGLPGFINQLRILISGNTVINHSINCVCDYCVPVINLAEEKSRTQTIVQNDDNPRKVSSEEIDAPQNIFGNKKDNGDSTIKDDVANPSIVSYHKNTVSFGIRNESINVPGSSLAEKISWMQTNVQSGGNYVMEVDADETIIPYDIFYGDTNNITITLKGDGTERIISLLINGSMFTVGSGITLVLDNNIVLQGRGNNTSSLVSVSSGGNFIMNHGSIITGNNSFSDSGGGVLVYGAFTMNGGAISGNIAGKNGGGVSVAANGVFTMKGGAIFGNTTLSGGGVSVFGDLIMRGGTISDNVAAAGGEVVVLGGFFDKTGGAIIGYAGDKSGDAVPAGSGDLQSGKGYAITTHTMSGSSGRYTLIKLKESAGPEINLSFNGRLGTFNGVWDN